MLLDLFAWLSEYYGGFRVFGYLTLRAIFAALTALTIALFVGPAMIRMLVARQIGQVVRDDGPGTHLGKKGTPTMGGALILIAVTAGTLLWADLGNRFVWIAISVTLAFGLIGFYDDYLKLVVRDPRGLAARWKYLWQSLAGIVAAIALWQTAETPAETALYVPFFKNVVLPMGAAAFVVLAYFVIVGTSNAVNLTDGLDGLAIMPCVMVAGGLAVFAYVTGRVDFAGYLQIPYVPGAGEMLIFCATIVGAGLGFLWFNTYPAQVFMGDIGALALGAALGVVAVIVRQEFVLAIMGGLFVLETVSVILQVASFRLRGKRIFRMAPIHHHYELKGWAEPKVIVRFWIISFMLVLIGLATLKLPLMQQAIRTPRSVIVGLGRTGVSAARHLAARGHRLVVTDSRANPPGLAELRRLVPGAATALGGFDPAVLEGADQVVVSPGVSLAEPFLRKAAAQGLDLVGDIELFAREAGGRVVGITGTNGKSTVTTLVGAFAQAAGLEVRVGGNLGEPALDLLAGPPAAMYVLELSSYQLETTWSLQPEAAAVLNVSPDHLDRYRDFAEYAAAKARIFERAATAIVNLDDEIVVRMPRPGQRSVGFSLRRADADFRLLRQAGEDWLAEGAEPVLPLAALPLPGRHNAANALAALAVGSVLGFPRAAMAGVLQSFRGLPHRAERVRDRQGVAWIDDSKGTNVGATVAAIEGFDGPLVLIAGGEGKGQDFAPLGPACQGKVKQAILIGRDAPLIAAALAGRCAVSHAASMEAAVAAAASIARAGDTVLLSPACASFDMFRDYAQRGDAFAAAVRELPS